MLKGLLIWFGILFSLSSFSQEERKMQLWNYNKFSVPVSENNFLEVVEKIHYTPKTSSIDVKFGDLWMKHKCNNWLEYAGGLRLGYARKNGEWLEERRPMFLTQVSRDIKKFELSISGRFEYRWFKEQEKHFRFRQKIDVNSPALSKWGLSFFTSEESFIKINSEKTHLARVYAGINTFSKDHFEMKIYYSLEKNKSFDYWNTTDIIGMNMNIRL